MGRAVSIVFLAALLGACGFQLRGDARLPEFMSRTHVAVGDDSTVFARELSLLLEANGVDLLSSPASGAATLRIDSQRMWREPLSVSGQARVREYLLVFEVYWRLEDADGEVVLERDRISVTRDYSFDEKEILAAQREEEFLRADLSRSMASQMLRRLEALAGARS